MSEVEISVVIPVYNVEKYLEECLDSVINQSFKNIEIICINDGSTDNSLNILNKYSKLDERIIIINQDNKGLGATRNVGIEKAVGKYIFFLDSDDYIDLTTLEELYHTCETKKLDFTLCQVKNYDENNDTYFTEKLFDLPVLAKTVKDKVFNYKDIGEVILTFNVVAWNKLYNLNFLRKINARFPENILFEDNIFFWKVLFNAKRIYFYQKHFYIYRRRDLSITTKGNKDLIDTIKVHNEVNNIFREYGLFEKYKRFLYNKKIGLIFIRYNQIQDEYKELFYKMMKEDYSIMINEEGGLSNLQEILEEKNYNILKNVIESDNVNEFDLKNELFSSKQEIKLLKNNIELLDEKVNKLEKELKESNDNYHKVNEELKKVYLSNSWKITKPLRKIKNR